MEYNTKRERCWKCGVMLEKGMALRDRERGWMCVYATVCASRAVQTSTDREVLLEIAENEENLPIEIVRFARKKLGMA
jgi:hypothetical protein